MAWVVAIFGVLLSWVFTPAAQIDRYWMGLSQGVIGSALLATGIYLMERLKPTLIDVLCIALGTWVFVNRGQSVHVTVPPAPTAVKPHKPLLPWRGDNDAEAFVEDPVGVGPGGVEVTCDLPAAYRKKNISSNGLGCCVFRSGDHAAHFQGVEALYGWPEWMVENHISGGGMPSKVDDLIAKCAKSRNMPVPEYIQHTAGDPAFLEQVLATGRMVCITYDGRDPLYHGSVAHMVNLCFLDKDLACIFDNNAINRYLWMSRNDFLSRWKGNSGGWAWCFLAPRPPAPPRN